MKREELELFAREAAKGLKTEKYLNDFSQMLTKLSRSLCKAFITPHKVRLSKF